jgi:hypothetical protein
VVGDAPLVEELREFKRVALQHEVHIAGQRASQQFVAHIAPHKVDLALVGCI